MDGAWRFKGLKEDIEMPRQCKDSSYHRSKVRSFMHPLNVGEGSEISGAPPTKRTGVGLATPTGVEVGRSRKKLGSVEDMVS